MSTTVNCNRCGAADCPVMRTPRADGAYSLTARCARCGKHRVLLSAEYPDLYSRIHEFPIDAAPPGTRLSDDAFIARHAETSGLAKRPSNAAYLGTGIVFLASAPGAFIALDRLGVSWALIVAGIGLVVHFPVAYRHHLERGQARPVFLWGSRFGYAMLIMGIALQWFPR